MHRRPIFAAALLALTVMLPSLARAADEQKPKSDKPAMLLRFASLDHLRGDFRYLAEVVGQAEKAKQLDGILKSQLGDKGLKGINNKKPIGAYGWVGAFGIDSKAVFLVPIADKKAFLDLISNTLDVKPDKGDDDVYTMNVEKIPAPVYFRFANDYVYITGARQGCARQGQVADAGGRAAGWTDRHRFRHHQHRSDPGRSQDERPGRDRKSVGRPQGKGHAGPHGGTEKVPRRGDR